MSAWMTVWVDDDTRTVVHSPGNPLVCPIPRLRQPRRSNRPLAYDEDLDEDLDPPYYDEDLDPAFRHGFERGEVNGALLCRQLEDAARAWRTSFEQHAFRRPGTQETEDLIAAVDALPPERGQ